ncbi:hypothetical protein RSAG8_13273, partial [Rhizoctonia solani AG-8 WAC10335]
MAFGVAFSLEDFNINADGVLGLGHTAFDTSMPTIRDALFAQRKIQWNVFGVSFAPALSEGTVDGELTFGGIDLTKYKGWMNWVKITDKEPFNGYWGFEQTIMIINAQQPPNDSSHLHSTETKFSNNPQSGWSIPVRQTTSSIVSNILRLTTQQGATMIYIIFEAFDVYSKFLTGSRFDPDA